MDFLIHNQQAVIWILCFLIAGFFFYRNLKKFRRSQAEALAALEDAKRTGKDKAVAQHPIIDLAKCAGCGTCVEVCPETALGLIDGKAKLVNAAHCVGHALCVKACPFEAIEVGLGDTSQREDIPVLSPTKETSRKGVYIVGELGGFALIRNAIAQGREVVEAIEESAKKAGITPEILVIGAGPSGLSTMLTAKSKGIKAVGIDKEGGGGTILKYPRRKLTLVQPVEVPLYGPLTKGEYHKEKLLEIWNKIIEKEQLQIETGRLAVQIEGDEGSFTVVLEDDSKFSGTHVVLAMGRRGQPRRLNVPGEEAPKVQYQLLDAQDYIGEHVLVVGGGDSAAEAAIALANQDNTTVTLSYRKGNFSRLKRRNEDRFLQYEKDGKIKSYYNSNVREFRQGEAILDLGGELVTVKNNFAFVFAGGNPPFALLKSWGIRFGGNNG